MKRKIGISTFTLQQLYGDERALEIAKEIGADAVDFNLCGENFEYKNPDSIYSKPEKEFVSYFENLKKKAKELGIEICQTHGRVSTFTNNSENDSDVIKNAKLDCYATSILGAPICVMHGVTTCHFSPDVDPKFMHQLNFDFFTKALPFAKEYGIKIATETFGDAPNFGCCDFFGNSDEFIKTYNRICAVEDFKDYFVTCMDTGHCNKAMRFNNNPTPADFIRMLGGSIKVLHLHDNNTFTDQHKIPLTGSIDWNDVFDALDEIGYKGIYNMEVALYCFGEGIEVETAEYAVKVMRNFLNKRYAD